jgi:glycosyltransferase involved in cell wall biosynthesis
MPVVLMIALHFPPMAGVGAKRPLHLVRHLPHFGWDPVVLSGDPALERIDPALSELIPQGVPVSREYRSRFVKQRSGSPGGGPGRGRGISYLDPLDRYLPSVPAGIREGRRLVKRYRPSVIHVCADPWSPLLAGVALRGLTRLPLVVDLRDPWSLHPGKMALRSPATRWAIRNIESRVFRAAKRIVLNTEECRDAYVAAYAGRLAATRFTAIRNAFDPEVFIDRPPRRGPGFRVLHFGDFRRFVPAEPLFRGFARFVTRERLEPGVARLECVGDVPPEARALAHDLGLDTYLDVLPPVPYREGLAILRGADVLALSNGTGIPVIPSKLYDYFAARRPILALAGNAEPNRLVVEARAGLAPPPDDPDAIANALVELRARAQGPGRGELPAEALRPFTAVEQARSFARVLSEASGV